MYDVFISVWNLRLMSVGVERERTWKRVIKWRYRRQLMVYTRWDCVTSLKRTMASTPSKQPTTPDRRPVLPHCSSTVSSSGCYVAVPISAVSFIRFGSVINYVLFLSYWGPLLVHNICLVRPVLLYLKVHVLKVCYEQINYYYYYY